MATALVCRDGSVGLEGVIVIDDTTLGPGLGGVRFKPYPDARRRRARVPPPGRGHDAQERRGRAPFGGAKAVIRSGPGVPRPRRPDAPLRRVRGGLRRRLPARGRHGHHRRPTWPSWARPAPRSRAPTKTPRRGPPSASRPRCAPRWPTSTDVATFAACACSIQGAATSGRRPAARSPGTCHRADRRRRRPAGTGRGRADRRGHRRPRRRGRHPLRRVRSLCRGRRARSGWTIAQLDCRAVAGAANDTLGDRADAQALAGAWDRLRAGLRRQRRWRGAHPRPRSGWSHARLRHEVLRIGDRAALGPRAGRSRRRHAA